MIKLEDTQVVGWEAAIRGMRNPMNSWEKSDSRKCGTCGDCEICIDYNDCPFDHDGQKFIIGPNDLSLMTSLRNAGTDHRKFMRAITVYVDITAPLYWWKEFDTYKVGTVANSCSTMHKIHEKEFTLDDFSYEHLIGEPRFVTDSKTPGIFGATQEFNTSSIGILRITCDALNFWRNKYLVALKTEPEISTGLSAKDIWWQMIQLLPSSYNQKRTVMLNYEVLANIYNSRKDHKLDEWAESHGSESCRPSYGFTSFCDWIKTLPYSELITGIKDLRN